MTHQVFKVGVAGAHSTGKTSFLKELEHRLKASGVSVNCVPSLANEAKALGFPILHEHTFDSTAWIVTRGISRELEAARAVDVILVDRPIPDAVGYLTAALRSRGASLSRSESDYLSTLVKIHVPTYNVVVMTKIDPSIPLDTTKHRDPDLMFRQMAETGINEALADARVDPQILRPDKRSKILDSVLRQIRDDMRENMRR